MVAPGFLQTPEVRRWLGGIQPAWTMLDFNSMNALLDEPSATNHSIRLEPDLAKAEISGSALVANALLLLSRAAETGGLKLTATGNLSRAVVEEMCGIMEWPGYDKDELFGFHKVINEPDFLPLHFVRILSQAAKLLRSYRGKLVPTPLGRKILNGDRTDLYRLSSFTSPSGVRTLTILTGTQSILGPRMRLVSFSGRFQNRPTIGWRERH